MGNGIKMLTAVNKGGAPYTIEELHVFHDEKTVLPLLLCADATCRTTVRFVPRHQQNLKGRIEPIDKPAYIGLTSDSKHTDSCRYNVVKRIAVIVDQSDPDFIGSLDDGKHDVRLLVLHNGLSGKPLSGSVPLPTGAAPLPGQNKESKEYITSGKKLDSYLRTTSDLLALRDLCETDAILAAQLTLHFGTKRIAWGDFFFTRETFDDAWNLLRRVNGNSHPLALVAEVKSHYSSKPGTKYQSTFLNCRSLYRKTEKAETMESFEVSVLHADAAWLCSFPVGSNIIMFGLWEYKEVKENPGKELDDGGRAITYITHKLTLKPKFKQQILAAS